jgi:hypothetical protein
MLKEVMDVIGKYINGSHGIKGRAQGAVVALALGLGCFKLLRIGFAVDWFFWRQFLRPAKNLKNYGSWAAVTGATDGIGRAYCDALAKQGVMRLMMLTRMAYHLNGLVYQPHGLACKLTAVNV